jgi:hypothetical protein
LAACDTALEREREVREQALELGVLFDVEKLEEKFG